MDINVYNIYETDEVLPLKNFNRKAITIFL